MSFLKKISLSLVVLGLFGVSTSYASSGKYKAVKGQETTKEELFKAIDNANLNQVQEIGNLKSLLSKTNSAGRTPIQQAAYKAKELTDMGMGIYSIPNYNEKYNNYLLIISYLLQNGAKEKELKNYSNELEKAKAKN